MPERKGRPNLGPAAADQNRSALVSAARRIYARHGHEVPFNTIAKEAGVGQGSLYRHFPNRIALAMAVFEENFLELEELAREHAADPRCFELVFARLVRQCVDSLGFIGIIASAGRDFPLDATIGRLAAVLTGPLDRAQREGLLRDTLTIDDLLLILRMLYGTLSHGVPGDAGPTVLAQRVLDLVGLPVRVADPPPG
ncbi:TetR/AcrR family transcriptional regulator [Planomonospora corallina]|uniref:TetR/AcrR family transcriptional regulator n=1 Tax=Planomonospora corallina TaxID=1806052 RepID=A0ABV8IEQ2_9ACTN